jgi:thiol-disulfide isomerase/thioredoxin
MVTKHKQTEMKYTPTIFLVLFLILNSTHAIAQEQYADQDSTTTYLTGKLTGKIRPDSAVLMLHGPFVDFGGASEADAAKLIVVKVERNGSFKFQVKTGTSPFHITLYGSNRRNQYGLLQDQSAITNYLVEPGDSIHIDVDSPVPNFSGRGSERFEAQAKIQAIDPGGKMLMRDSNDYFRKNPKRWLQEKDSLLAAQLNTLASFKSKLSESAYAIIRADIIGVNRAWLYRRISFAGPFFVAGTPMDKALDDLFLVIKQRPAYIDPEDRSALSPEYIHYLYNKMRIEAKYDRIKNGKSLSIDENYYDIIISTYTGIVRDKLLAYWLFSISQFNLLQETNITQSLSVMQTPVFIQLVKNLESTFYGNKPILDYGFQDINGKTVRISDYRGKVVVIDLWFSGCIPCLAVAKGLRQVERNFENAPDVVFLSISTDKDITMWLKSIDKTKMAEPNSYYISPATKYLYTNGTGQKNPFVRKYIPSESYPYLLLIDKKGKIYSSTPERPITDEGRKILVDEVNAARNIAN